MALEGPQLLRAKPQGLEADVVAREEATLVLAKLLVVEVADVGLEGPPLLRAWPQWLEADGVALEGPTLVLERVQGVEAADVVAQELAVLHFLQGFLPNPGGLEPAAAVVAREGPTLFLARPQAVEAADVAQEGPPLLQAEPAAVLIQLIQQLNCFLLLLNEQFGPFL